MRQRQVSLLLICFGLVCVFFHCLASMLTYSPTALDAESEHMVQEAIDQMLATGRGEDGNSGK